jgi:hypothetical protein
MAMRKPAPRAGEILQRLEALLRFLGKRAVPGDQQVGEGAVLVTADASADLVQLAQAEVCPRGR